MIVNDNMQQLNQHSATSSVVYEYSTNLLYVCVHVKCYVFIFMFCLLIWMTKERNGVAE